MSHYSAGQWQQRPQAQSQKKVFWLPRDGLVSAIVKSRVPLLLGRDARCELCRNGTNIGYLVEAERPFTPMEIASLKQQSASYVQKYLPVGWTVPLVHQHIDNKEIGKDISSLYSSTSNSAPMPAPSPQPAPLVAPTAQAFAQTLNRDRGARTLQPGQQRYQGIGSQRRPGRHGLGGIREI